MICFHGAAVAPDYHPVVLLLNRAGAGMLVDHRTRFFCRRCQPARIFERMDMTGAGIEPRAFVAIVPTIRAVSIRIHHARGGVVVVLV